MSAGPLRSPQEARERVASVLRLISERVRGSRTCCRLRRCRALQMQAHQARGQIALVSLQCGQDGEVLFARGGDAFQPTGPAMTDKSAQLVLELDRMPKEMIARTRSQRRVEIGIDVKKSELRDLAASHPE